MRVGVGIACGSPAWNCIFLDSGIPGLMVRITGASVAQAGPGPAPLLSVISLLWLSKGIKPPRPGARSTVACGGRGSPYGDCCASVISTSLLAAVGQGSRVGRVRGGAVKPPCQLGDCCGFAPAFRSSTRILLDEYLSRASVFLISSFQYCPCLRDLECPSIHKGDFARVRPTFIRRISVMKPMPSVKLVRVPCGSTNLKSQGARCCKRAMRYP